MYQPCLPEKDILEFLQTRRKKLDAITISGGEPTLQEDLTEFIRNIRSMDFAVKLDSNGSRPDVLETLMNNRLLDYIALDIKAPAAKYPDAVNARVNYGLICDSIRIVLSSGIEHEFRTTVVASQLSIKDIDSIARDIAGANRYALQKFQSAKTLNSQYMEENTYPDDDFLKMKKKLEKQIPSVIIR